MLDTPKLLALGGTCRWPKSPIHVRVTGFGDGALMAVLLDTAIVRLVGGNEINEFRIAACKYVGMDGSERPLKEVL